MSLKWRDTGTNRFTIIERVVRLTRLREATSYSDAKLNVESPRDGEMRNIKNTTTSAEGRKKSSGFDTKTKHCKTQEHFLERGTIHDILKRKRK